MQEAARKGSSEVKDLRKSLKQLREELDKQEAIKQQEVQDALSSSIREITSLKQTIQTTREKLNRAKEEEAGKKYKK